ncbi:hypothetical protein B0T26DRAFT_727900 [Lasiosphaeria miniovina]|uniref:Uncharacterized protein n=1 Tax=Lasiosphaeria miniovina TaxID=1954250 RepID=A0AA39ZZZ2_9PEZI|nr:uncharacterized protein B0T26DRAFT_727900 [Lasiosphaeria miniovina]KAK0706750.1 hypothetical protein B0T26DRAFT_727900 [Lasiosphaeria miniovina]
MRYPFTTVIVMYVCTEYRVLCTYWRACPLGNCPAYLTEAATCGPEHWTRNNAT